MKRRIVAMLLAGAMLVGAMSACGNTGGDSGKSESSAVSDEAVVAAGPDDTTEPYAFTVYCNYDWWTVRPWGQDETSKYMKEKFNVDVAWTKPDADPSAKLNLMVASGDLPDSMVMDRNADLIKTARLGALVPLEQFMYEGNPYDENILPQTRELLKTEGKLYGIPNWARKNATGGNFSWNINQETWRSVGSPELKTLEDLHDYGVAVKEAGLKTHSGQDVIPFITGDTPDGFKVYSGMFRSLGGRNLVENYYTQENNTIQFCMRNELFTEALKTANQWFREGLFDVTAFTDTVDQVIEKLTNGRPAMAYYDFGQEDINHYRQILMESTNNKNSYELLTDPIFPPAEGVAKVYGEENSTVGWNVNVITTKAENPQRIFDLFSWMLTKEGSINIMYGPRGGLWDELDENGNPILKKPETELTSAEKDAAGCWFWTQPAQSDNFDLTKFAVNAALPVEQQNWVTNLQANVFTPKDNDSVIDGQKFITDENVGLADTIDPQSDLGVQRTLVQDQCKSQLPKIMMAKDDAEFESLCDGLLKFAEDNGIAEVEKAYNDKHQANCELQGGSYYEKTVK